MADTPEQTETPAAAEPPAPPPRPIVARAGGEYRLKRLALAAMLLVFGVLFLRDGFVRYPRENQAAVDAGHAVLPHPGYDVPLQRGLGIALVPASLAMVGWVLWSSRGQVVLDDADLLHMPGHPPVPLDAITQVDRARWDRKGIAFAEYQLPDGTAGRLRLDDFLYQRTPIDQVFDAVMVAVERPAVITSAAAEIDPA